MTAATPGAARTALSSRLRAPLAAASVAVAATAAVAVRDPHVAGSWGVCPWLVATGTFCPGCGGLRAVHDLVHGRVLDALSSNAVVVVGAVVVTLLWVGWVRARLRGLPVRMPAWVGPRSVYTVVALLLAFAIVRNLPVGAWLAPALVS